MRVSSYVCGTSAEPLIGETIGAYFDQMAARHAGREALVVRSQGVRLTYADLQERVDALAAALLDLRLQPGDRIGIWAANCAEWVLTQFASAKAGLILVTVNPAYRQIEFEHAMRKSGCKALVAACRFKSSDYLAMIRSVPAGSLPELRTVICIGEGEGLLRFDDIAARRASRERLEAVASTLQFDDPINIQFTSGTTGLPKGATLTHHNILNNAYFVARTMGLNEGDRLCVPVPLYHCFGMVMSSLACVTQGATMVLPSESFDPQSALEAIEAEGCTHIHGVPTMFLAELEHPEFDQFNLQSLRGGIMAGSPCPIELMRRVVDRMHLREVTIAYGMTETSPVSFQSRIDDPLERRVTTVGRIHPHVEAKIVDRDGRITSRGVAGELLTRGYSVMRGYWGDAEQTASAIDEAGWMHTGDLAVIDEEGYCNITGRLKDMVIRGGENIYPREVEEFLYTHPKIEAVQVFGVPDTKYGEELCAWVKVRAGCSLDAGEVREYCSGQIAHYKIPKYVCFVGEFPMTVTGKVQKFVMQREMIKRLGLAAERSA